MTTHPWMRTTFALLCGALLGSNPTFAQVSDNAHWIWLDAGNPPDSAPAGKAWFRREVRAFEPSTGALRIICDDSFTLWVNGQNLGTRAGGKVHRFNLNGIVERGLNVIAVEVDNPGGKAGLFVDGEIRGQGGNTIPFDTPAEWKGTAAAPAGDGWRLPRFDDSAWQKVKDLGPHADSPWKDLAIAGTFLDRFEIPAGFELAKVAKPNVTGSFVAITWGNDDRLIASIERGPVVSLGSSARNGIFDQSIIYTDAVKNCQGLCQVFDDLYVVGDGPQGTGLYKLPDRNRDHQADEVILLARHRGGMGEHGPHDVVFGPDGQLYHNLGNHAWIQNTPEPNSPCRAYEEGYLLEPKFEDAGGHAVGIKAPGGTIWRFSPDGKKWWMETNGFRNQYDVAFNSRGDLFTFDSDMEWDVNLPWYRPVRVNHCVPGAEFGWRSGAAKWPDYYFDSLPATVDVGRGSPTGVVFYEHRQFPERLHGAFLVCDWSMGRILAVTMKRQGATYTGTFESLVSGNPLNVSDIEIAPDGSMIFATGGRGTEGGIYRLSWLGTGSEPAPASSLPPSETLRDALTMPQAQSHWARERIAGIRQKVGEDVWASGLKRAALAREQPEQALRALSLLAQIGPAPDLELLSACAAGDRAPEVRQFAVWLMGSLSGEAAAAAVNRLVADRDPVVRRRACEALVRGGFPAKVDPLIENLAHPDRFVRWAARIALERAPVEEWREKILASDRVDVQLHGLLALHRLGEETLSTDDLLARIQRLYARQPRDERARLDLRRLTQLALLRAQAAGGPSPEARKYLVDVVALEFDRMLGSSDRAVGSPELQESARILAALDAEHGVPLLLSALERARAVSEPLQTHYALCLRYLSRGWGPNEQRRLLDWYETTAGWEGGNSLQGYLRNIVAATVERFGPQDRKALLLAWRQRPHASRLLLGASSPAQIADFDAVVASLVNELESNPHDPLAQQMAGLLVDALGKSTDAHARELLFKLYSDYPDRRELIVRTLAQRPTPEAWALFVQALQYGDGTTLQAALKGLQGIDKRPDAAEPFRQAILAGLKLGNNGGGLAVQLLEKWTSAPHGQGRNVSRALAFYQEWYRKEFPAAAAPELAPEDKDKTRYTVAELVEFLERNPAGQRGDAARGKLIFTKATCVKCHKILNEGEGVGPDLTTLRRRFQKKEIVEAILTPSAVISDQYRMLTVETTDGFVHNGMPLPDGPPNSVTLLLSDATKITIPKEKIAEQVPSTVSVMPESLFKELSLEEIADLFAYLETTRSNPEPAPAAGAGGSGK